MTQGRDTGCMPTPHFSFRLPVDQADSLRDMAKLYGAKDTSSFLREMVGAMCSNDMEKVKAFNGRLATKMGEQLTLKLNAVLDEATGAGKKAKKARKVAQGRKGGGRAGKRN